jgi:hypothetical protein
MSKSIQINTFKLTKRYIKQRENKQTQRSTKTLDFIKPPASRKTNKTKTRDEPAEK